MEDIAGKINSYFLNSESHLVHNIGENSPNLKEKKFRCDYCGLFFPIDEMHISSESDSKYENSVGTLGRPIIKATHKSYITKKCSRCNKFHSIAGWIHFFIHVIFISIAIYVCCRNKISFENLLHNIVIAVILAQIIRFIDWFIIKLFFNVNRKPIRL